MVRNRPSSQCLFRRHPYGLYHLCPGSSRKRPASHYFLRFGIRTDKCCLPFRGKRQYAVLIFQQYEGFYRRFIRQLSMVLTEIRTGLLCLVRTVKRIFKQPQPVFKLQHSQDAFIEKRLVQSSAPHQPGQTLRIYPRHHIDIDARFQRTDGGISPVLRNPVDNRLTNCRVIRYQHTVKFHFSAQNTAKQTPVYCCRNALHCLKCGHHHSASGFYGTLISRQIKLSKRFVREFHCLVLPPAFRRAVTRKMLDAGCQRVHAALLPLIAFHQSLCIQAV